MKIICFLALLLFFSVSHAQNKKLILRMYVSPGIGTILKRQEVLNDGVITSTELSKKGKMFFSPAFGFLKPLNNSLSLLADFAINHKGYMVVNSQDYNNGLPGGKSYEREDYSFFETTLTLQKQLVLKNSSNNLLLASGLFYGLNDGYLGQLLWPPDVHTRNLIGNDFGFSISGGLLKNNLLTAIEWKQGLNNIRNDKKFIFKTSMVSLKVGYEFSNKKKINK